MKHRQPPDALLLLATFILLGIGLVMVYSSSSEISLARHNISYYFLRRQAVFALVGLVALYTCMRFNYWHWRQLVKPVFWLNFILLGLVLVPGIGVSRTDAQRWINLGFMQFQPSELTKFAMVLYTASYLTGKKDKLASFARGILPVLVVVATAFALIMLQPDLGTGVAIVGTVVVMLFAGGARMVHIFGLGAVGLAAIGVMIWLAPYRMQRFITFLDPWQDVTGSGWQVIQSLLAVGSGGLFGVGLGHSRQKFHYLPEPWNDFIFAIICEEFGFLGGAAVIILFLILIWRGFRIALAAPDLFGQFLAMGLTVMIAVQVSINLGVVLAVLPVTGINLPLISYGGTSLMLTLAAIGILLNISRYSH